MLWCLGVFGQRRDIEDNRLKMHDLITKYCTEHSLTIFDHVTKSQASDHKQTSIEEQIIDQIDD